MRKGDRSATFPGKVGAVLLAALLVPHTAAAAPSFDLSYKGFATAAFGDIVSGDHELYLGYRCPCYIANWEYAGVYTDQGWEGAPESLIGVQGQLKLYRPLSVVAQIVARGANEKVTPDWVYLDYDLGQDWNIQAGRERLPLYSDTASIGYSYPWVRPPPEVYGWEIYDYDGGKLSHRANFGDWTVEGDVYAGRRATGNNRMESKLEFGYPIYEAWNSIYGGYVDASNDIIDVRVLYQHNKIDAFGHPTPTTTVVLGNRDPQDFADATLNLDYHNFLVRGEIQSVIRTSENLYSTSYYLSGGYRLDRITGMLTHSWYYERLTPGDPQPFRFDTSSVTLRWDFHKSWDAKLQFDLSHDSAAFQFVGDARLVTLAVDTVF